jgi:hypothetical protein
VEGIAAIARNRSYGQREAIRFKASKGVAFHAVKDLSESIYGQPARLWSGISMTRQQMTFN